MSWEIGDVIVGGVFGFFGHQIGQSEDGNIETGWTDPTLTRRPLRVQQQRARNSYPYLT